MRQGLGLGLATVPTVATSARTMHQERQSRPTEADHRTDSPHDSIAPSDEYDLVRAWIDEDNIDVRRGRCHGALQELGLELGLG
jgi:hypothetical protein